ncbi:J domain-containing protein [Bdellovibrionota bacterium FG-1]
MKKSKEVFHKIAFYSGRLWGEGKQAMTRLSQFKESLPEMIRRGLVFSCFLTFGVFLLRAGSLDQRLPSREKIKQRFRNVLPEDIAERLAEVVTEQKRFPTTFQIKKMCEVMGRSLPLESKQELLKLLIAFLRIDGGIEIRELEGLRWVAEKMGMEREAFDRLFNTFSPNTAFVNTDSFYAILGVDKSASPEEIRRAYRRLASMHHPDRFATQSAEVQRAAHHKFIEINKTFQRLKGN